MRWTIAGSVLAFLGPAVPCQGAGASAGTPAALIDAIEEGLDRDPAVARDASEVFLERFGEREEAARVRNLLLPTAWLLTDGVPGLKRYLDGAEPGIAPKERPFLLVWRGDCAAFSGDLESAQKLYRESFAALPLDLERTDPRRRLRAEADVRIKLVGRRVPDLRGDWWLGSEPHSLSDFRGRLLVLDFWATWCPPCRVAMPRLDALYREYGSRRLVVWGVTMPFSYGYLPASPEQILSGGAQVQGMEAQDFRPHLEAFRRNSGISYPFVVTTQADHDRFLVDNRPTLIVVDEERRVLFASFGYEAERIVRALVRHRLGGGR